MLKNVKIYFQATIRLQIFLKDYGLIITSRNLAFLQIYGSKLLTVHPLTTMILNTVFGDNILNKLIDIVVLYLVHCPHLTVMTVSTCLISSFINTKDVIDLTSSTIFHSSE